MPTYEYACKSCGEHLEVVQSFKDDALTECPNCGGNLKKVFGSIGIVFKGSGFYKNDSRSGSGGPKTATAASETTSDVANGSSTGDAAKATTADGAAPSKPAAAPAPAPAAESPKKSSSPSPSGAAAAS